MSKKEEITEKGWECIADGLVLLIKEANNSIGMHTACGTLGFNLEKAKESLDFLYSLQEDVHNIIEENNV